MKLQHGTEDVSWVAGVPCLQDYESSAIFSKRDLTKSLQV